MTKVVRESHDQEIIFDDCDHLIYFLEFRKSSNIDANYIHPRTPKFLNYYPQRAQRAGGISKGLVISWLWLSLTTLVIARDKMWGKITKFYDNFEPPYLWTENSF